MSAGAIRGRDIGLEVLRALGIDTPKVADFSIHFPCDGIVRVKAEILVRADNAHAFVKKMKEFELHAKEIKS